MNFFFLVCDCLFLFCFISLLQIANLITKKKEEEAKNVDFGANLTFQFGTFFDIFKIECDWSHCVRLNDKFS